MYNTIDTLVSNSYANFSSASNNIATISYCASCSTSYNDSIMPIQSQITPQNYTFQSLEKTSNNSYNSVAKAQNYVSNIADNNNNYFSNESNPIKQYIKNQETEQHFKPTSFLSPRRPHTQFVGNAKQIKEHIERTFMEVQGTKLPQDIQINISTEEEMKKVNPNMRSSILGFCLNRVGFGVSEIFVKEGPLDEVMLTIGHELGHAMSKPLNNIIDEEAKAFSFSIAWMNAIKEKNIAGLAMNIDINPAENGIHNVAFGFVQKLINQGNKAIGVFKGLVNGIFSKNKIVNADIL